MIAFNTMALMPSDIIAGRNMDPHDRIAKGIRILLNSYTNHNALVLQDANTGSLMIGDTLPPVSRLRPLSDYEEKVNSGMYVVRVWRMLDMTDSERLRVGWTWQLTCEGIKYPTWSVCRLWVFRILNSLPYEIRGAWCTKNTFKPFTAVLGPERSPARRTNGAIDLNPTPKSAENRLVSGVLRDVTDDVMIPV